MVVGYICSECKKYVNCEADPGHAAKCFKDIKPGSYSDKKIGIQPVLHAYFNTSVGHEILGKSHIKEIEKERNLTCMDYREHMQDIKHKQKVFESEKDQKFENRLNKAFYLKRLERGEI